MKKILIVEGRRSVGGGQIMTRRICNVLKQNYSLSLLLPEGKGETAKLMADIPQYYFPMKEYTRGKKSFCDLYKFVYNFFVAFRVIFRLVRSKNFDLIYIQAPSLVPLFALIGNLSGKKIIVHLHVVHTDPKSKKVLNYFLKYKSIIQILGVSDYTLIQLCPLCRSKAMVLYNYVETQNIGKPVLAGQKIRIAVIGDVCAVKGQHLLFKAVQYLEQEIEVIVAGTIIDDVYYRSIIDHDYSFSYFFIGKTEHIIELLDTVDIIVIPSTISETFSLAMVEAWSKGIPTIASSLGGMKELVTTFLPEYKEDLLFTPLSAKELGFKINVLLNNTEKYHHISSSVKEVADTHFCKEIFQRKLLDCLKAI